MLPISYDALKPTWHTPWCRIRGIRPRMASGFKSLPFEDEPACLRVSPFETSAELTVCLMRGIWPRMASGIKLLAFEEETACLRMSPFETSAELTVHPLLAPPSFAVKLPSVPSTSISKMECAFTQHIATHSHDNHNINHNILTITFVSHE